MPPNEEDLKWPCKAWVALEGSAWALLLLSVCRNGGVAENSQELSGEDK